MSENYKDLSAGELAAVKKQLQRVKALGDGKITITFEKHRLTNIGIFAEIDMLLTDSAPSLDHPETGGKLLD